MRDNLAKLGGSKVRNEPPPFRAAMGKAERQAVLDVLEYYEQAQQDPPYEGFFQRNFETSFAEKMGGGFARAVSSGSVSCFVAVRALRLPAGSEVIVPGVTDSGSIFAIIEAGLTPVIVDTMPNSYNTNWEEIEAGITQQTSAVFAVHMAGEPLDIPAISNNAKLKNLKLIEDCSQAPFARVCPKQCDCKLTMCQGSLVGMFGDVSAYSTMYRKSLHTGGSGGVVFTKNEQISNAVIEESDRGRPKWSNDYRSGDPGHATVSALNFNTDEFSCAIGSASLLRLDDTIQRRREFLFSLDVALEKFKPNFELMNHSRGQSPFFIPILVGDEFKTRKLEIAEMMKAEGVSLLPSFQNIVADWEITKKLNLKVIKSSNAESMKARSFNLFLNENFGEREINEIVLSLEKILGHVRTK